MLTKYPTLPIHHHLLLLQCRCSSDFNPLLFSLIIIIIFKIISLYGPANTKPAILLTLYRCRCFISSLFFSFAIADKIIKKKIIYPDQYGSDAFSMSSCYRSKSHISQKFPKEETRASGRYNDWKKLEQTRSEVSLSLFPFCCWVCVCLCLCLSHLLWINDEISSFREVIVR